MPRFEQSPEFKVARHDAAREIKEAREVRNQARRKIQELNPDEKPSPEELQRFFEDKESPRRKLFEVKKNLRLDYQHTEHFKKIADRKNFEHMGRAFRPDEKHDDPTLTMLNTKAGSMIQAMESFPAPSAEGDPVQVTSDFLKFLGDQKVQLKALLYSSESSRMFSDFDFVLKYLPRLQSKVARLTVPGVSQLLMNMVSIQMKIMRFIEDNLQQIERQIKTGDAAAPKAAVWLMKNGGEIQKEKGKNLFMAYQDVMEGELKSWIDPEIAAAMIAVGTRKNAQKTARSIMDLIAAGSQTAKTAGVLQALHDFPEDVSKEAFKNFSEIFREIMSRYKLPAEKIYSAWDDSNRIFRNDAIAKNLSALFDAEKGKPGVASELHAKFGISDFGRYSMEFMTQQIANADKTDLPYGIVMLPQADHNGAFYQMSWLFHQMMKTLDGKYYIRAFECESKQDVARAFLRCRAKYGTAHKISFAFIGGHGTPNSIQFGGKDQRHFLQTKDLKGSGIRKTSGFFEEGATVILASCSTGARGGIAEQMKDDLHLNLIAPDEVSAVQWIKIEEEEAGRLKFSVDYRNANSMMYEAANS
jgi:hypothetical protein